MVQLTWSGFISRIRQGCPHQHPSQEEQVDAGGDLRQEGKALGQSQL